MAPYTEVGTLKREMDRLFYRLWERSNGLRAGKLHAGVELLRPPGVARRVSATLQIITP